MSTVRAPMRRGRPTAAPRTSAPPAAALHAEWTKLRTVPSTAWLVLGTVAITVMASAGTLAGAEITACPMDEQCVVDPTKLSLTGVWLGQAVIATLAALAMTSEYGTRMVIATLAANPRRVAVLLAKAGVVTAVALGAGVLAVAGSLLSGVAILQGSGFAADNDYSSLSLGDEPTLRAAAGTVLYFGLISVLGLGIGAIVRDTAGAVASVLGLLYIFPIVIGVVSDPDWNRWLNRLGPNAGQAIQNTVGLDQQPIGPWAGLGVLAGWSAGAMLLGGLLFRYRDA
jgi:ABC-2 type transport system permease protein